MFVALIGSLLATVILTVFVLVVLAMLLRWHERTDKSVDRQNDLLRAKAIVRGENQPGQTQNHIIAVMPLKRGWFSSPDPRFFTMGNKAKPFLVSSRFRRNDGDDPLCQVVCNSRH